MPSIAEITEKLKTLDSDKYRAAVSYILYLADAPSNAAAPEGTIDTSAEERILYAAGSMKKYANPALIPQEKDAWRKAVIKKHEKIDA